MGTLAGGRNSSIVEGVQTLAHRADGAFRCLKISVLDGFDHHGSAKSFDFRVRARHDGRLHNAFNDGGPFVVRCCPGVRATAASEVVIQGLASSRTTAGRFGGVCRGPGGQRGCFRWTGKGEERGKRILQLEDENRHPAHLSSAPCDPVG